jgi:hypothetical protein
MDVKRGVTRRERRGRDPTLDGGGVDDVGPRGADARRPVVARVRVSAGRRLDRPLRDLRSIAKQILDHCAIHA